MSSRRKRTPSAWRSAGSYWTCLSTGRCREEPVRPSSALGERELRRHQNNNTFISVGNSGRVFCLCPRLNSSSIFLCRLFHSVLVPFLQISLAPPPSLTYLSSLLLSFISPPQEPFKKGKAMHPHNFRLICTAAQ